MMPAPPRESERCLLEVLERKPHRKLPKRKPPKLKAVSESNLGAGLNGDNPAAVASSAPGAVVTLKGTNVVFTFS